MSLSFNTDVFIESRSNQETSIVIKRENTSFKLISETCLSSLTIAILLQQLTAFRTSGGKCYCIKESLFLSLFSSFFNLKTDKYNPYGLHSSFLCWT